MTFDFSYVATTRDSAADHLATLYDQLPEPVYYFVHTALMNLRSYGGTSVSIQGHLCTNDPNSDDTSTCTIEVKPLGKSFVG